MPGVNVEHRRSGAREFPRNGAWALLGDRLGIIFEKTSVKGEKGSPDKVQVELHLVDKNGETEEVVKGVPVEKIKQASLADIRHLKRCAHMTPFDAARLGYEISDKDRRSMTPLQRKETNLLLDDSDAAQAEIDESTVRLKQAKERARQQKIANDKRAIELEEQIEKDRIKFMKDAEAKREALAKKILSEE